MPDFRILHLERSIEPLRKRILEHPVYSVISDPDALKVFMEFHVFAVWDFMSLLKALQQRLSCVETAWVPTENRLSRRLINEIVLGEESDVDLNGNPASHYELYLDAMRQAGADTKPIIHFVKTLQRGFKVKDVLHYNVAEIDRAAIDFMRSTFELIKRNKVHEMAAAFTFGRENLIPDMFSEIVRELNEKQPENWSAFVYYLDRHIELDGDEHGPAALKMIREVCGDDDIKWLEAEEACLEALQARIDLWDAVYAAIKITKGSTLASL